MDPESLGTPFYLLESMEAADPGEIKLDDDEVGFSAISIKKIF